MWCFHQHLHAWSVGTQCKDNYKGITRDEEKEQAQSMIVGPTLRAVLKLESQVWAFQNI